MPTALAVEAHGSENGNGDMSGNGATALGNQDLDNATNSAEEDIEDDETEIDSGDAEDGGDTTEGTATQTRNRFGEVRKIGSRIQESKLVRVNRAIAAQSMQRRQAIKEMKEDLEDCAGRRTSVCNNIRKEAKEKTIENLKSTADSVLALLKKAENKIVESGNTDEMTTENLEQIRAEIANVEEVITKIDDLSESSTKGEIKDLAKSLRESAKEVKKRLREQVHKIASRKVNTVFEKTEMVEEKLAAKIKEFEEKGIDTGSVDTSEFKQALVEAQDLFEKAKSTREQALEHKEEDLMQDSNEMLRNAFAKLKEAHKELKEILKELRSLVQENETN